MTTIEKEKKAEKVKDTESIKPEFLEMVSFDVDFEIPAKKEHEIEGEKGEISKDEIDLNLFIFLFDF